MFNICYGIIIGLPVRATPNQEKKKKKNADKAPRRLCVSHPHFNGAVFCGEETGHFRLSGEQTLLGVDLERTQNYRVPLLALYLRGMII